MQESTAHKTARTSFWGAIERVSTLSVQFIITMILARLLSPSDYGIIAMLTIFIAISHQFVECGISNALIRKLNCTQTDYSTAFYFNVGVSFVVYAILFVLAPYIAVFYNMPVLTSVLRIYSLSLIFQSFRIVQYAQLCKRLEFKKMAKVTAFVTLISGIIGVAMAYHGYGVWSLVAQGIFLHVFTSTAYFLVLRWVPSLDFSQESFRYLWGFGSKMLVSGIISVIYTNIYSLVIGKVYDSRSLGIFNRAHHLSHTYPDIMKSIFAKNSLPIMAEHQNDLDRLRKVYREFVVIVAFLTFPIVLLLIVVAKPFILFFLTEKWADSIIYLQIFCASALLLPVNWINLNLLQALGRSDLTLKAEVLKKFVGLGIVSSMFWFGPLVLAICYSAFDVFAYSVNLYYAKKLIGVSYLQQIKDMLPCLFAALISSVIAFIVMEVTDVYLLQMIIAFIVSMGVYVFVTRNLFKMNIYMQLRQLRKMNNIKYTCVVDTTYTLSLYLLLQTEEAIRETAFFVGSAIPENMSYKLPNVIRIDNRKGTYRGRLKKLKHRAEALLKWRFRHHTMMYAQDHLTYSAHIIGSNKYILLEDAPRIYTNYKTIKFMKPIFPTSLKSKFTSWLYWGNIGRLRLGTNKQCIDRIVTTKEDLGSDLIVGKKYTYVDLAELWKKSSKEKQEYIKDMFGVTDEILFLPEKCSVIFFSQPFMQDCKMNEEEMLAIYDPFIKKYISQGVVIKPHPRDKFDYKKYYPNIEILNCKAPMQLLSAMGVRFKTAVTVCSSAVSSMPEDAEIVWIGAQVNPKILNVYGDLKCPK